MFGGFEAKKDEQASKRWFASAGTSLVIFVILGIGLVILARQTSAKSTQEQSIDVAFHAPPEPEKKPPPPPPPPPPPKVAAKVKRPGAAAPPPPTAIPDAPPEEAEPTERIDATALQAEFGDGGEDAAAAAAARARAAADAAAAAAAAAAEEAARRRAEASTPDPVFEVDPDATPPKALASNTMPAYPEQARHKGIEAEVILKIQISARGEVVAAKVVRGAEPFASAALAAVKTWRYSPATLDGRPIVFVRLVKIPFRLH